MNPSLALWNLLPLYKSTPGQVFGRQFYETLKTIPSTLFHDNDAEHITSYMGAYVPEEHRPRVLQAAGAAARSASPHKAVENLVRSQLTRRGREEYAAEVASEIRGKIEDAQKRHELVTHVSRATPEGPHKRAIVSAVAKLLQMPGFGSKTLGLHAQVVHHGKSIADGAEEMHGTGSPEHEAYTAATQGDMKQVRNVVNNRATGGEIFAPNKYTPPWNPTSTFTPGWGRAALDNRGRPTRS